MRQTSPLLRDVHSSMQIPTKCVWHYVMAGGELSLELVRFAKKNHVTPREVCLTDTNALYTGHVTLAFRVIR